jgi:hypothetical protein
LSAGNKYWSYTYLVAPNFGGDIQYDGADGALNDGIESYYGDSYSDPDGNGGVDGYDWGPYWGWWNSYVSPSVIVQMGLPLQISSIGVRGEYGGGGIGYPSTMTVSHRTDSSSSWTIVQTGGLSSNAGWSELQLSNSPVGGEMKVELTSSAEHTIISEFSIQGVCGP